jgi:hypothetical protein
MRELVFDINKDLEFVKWSENTPQDDSVFSAQGAKSFTGAGVQWTHNLIHWMQDGVERCDGTAIRNATIVRYTPALAEKAWASAKGSQ